MTEIHITRPHHVALSVNDIDETVRFYRIFGFAPVLKWSAPDGSLDILHLLGPGSLCLELFAYTANDSQPALEMDVGNDLSRTGLKHFGLQVGSLQDAHRGLSSMPGVEITDIKRGRTEIDYFFVRDPNGIWVEIVQDERHLDPSHPVMLNGEST